MFGLTGGGSSVLFLPSCFRFCPSALEAEAVVADVMDVAVVSKAVEECCRHLGNAEHTSPLAEAEVDGDDDAGVLLKPGEQVEQQRSA